MTFQRHYVAPPSITSGRGSIEWPGPGLYLLKYETIHGIKYTVSLKSEVPCLVGFKNNFTIFSHLQRDAETVFFFLKVARFLR